MRRLPVVVLVAASVAAAMIAVPLLSLVARVEWSGAWAAVSSAPSREAIALSLVTASVATLVVLVLGVPLASVLARIPGRAAHWSRAVILLPLVLPPVVGGVALLAAFGRQGLIGEWLESTWGVTVAFTPVAVVLAQVFVALPFLVVSVEGALRTHAHALGDAAATLGARPWQQWWKVALPAARPGIAAGLALAWARALGEFGATITFAGGFPGRTATVPVTIYETLQHDAPAAIMLATVMMVVNVAILALLRHRWLTGGALEGRPGSRS